MLLWARKTQTGRDETDWKVTTPGTELSVVSLTDMQLNRNQYMVICSHLIRACIKLPVPVEFAM